MALERSTGALGRPNSVGPARRLRDVALLGSRIDLELSANHSMASGRHGKWWTAVMRTSPEFVEPVYGHSARTSTASAEREPLEEDTMCLVKGVPRCSTQI